MCEQTTTSEILKLFSFLCSVPHGSGNEKQLSDKLCEHLYQLGLSPEQDVHGNIVCDIAGAEDAPLVALQAHLDMVCAVGSPDYHPATDPIRPIERDGWLCTAGESSLGADCGAGAAVMLWLAAHDELPHPPLRLIFTVCEEVGLTGANAMHPSCMDGVSHFINLDGFCFGKAVVGSAGGVRMRMTRPVETESVPAGMQAYRLTLSGLLGGHSGADIDRRRANAIEQLGHALHALVQHQSVRLFSIRCGTASNAIPADASCAFVTDRDPSAWLAQINAQLALAHGITEPDARFELISAELPETVYTEELTHGIIGLAAACRTGVWNKHELFENLVGDSINLGVLRVEKNEIVAQSMARFSNPGADEEFVGQHAQSAESNGFTFAEEGRYPVWPVLADSTLSALARDCYQAVTGTELAVEAYHVGLEPAVFYGYNANAQFITLGMTIENCHSPSERWAIGTIEPFTKMIEKILAALAGA